MLIFLILQQQFTVLCRSMKFVRPHHWALSLSTPRPPTPHLNPSLTPCCCADCTFVYTADAPIHSTWQLTLHSFVCSSWRRLLKIRFQQPVNQVAFHEVWFVSHSPSDRREDHLFSAFHLLLIRYAVQVARSLSLTDVTECVATCLQNTDWLHT